MGEGVGGGWRRRRTVIPGGLWLGLGLGVALGVVVVVLRMPGHLAVSDGGVDPRARAFLSRLADAPYPLGHPGFDVTVTVFSDLECPACARFDPVLSAVARDPDTRMRKSHRHFPLARHGQVALDGALAAECVGKEKGADAFHAYVAAIFERTVSGGVSGAEELAALAEPLGVERTVLGRCMQSPGVRQRLEEDLALAREIAVRATPTLVIHHAPSDRYVAFPGAVSEERLRALVSEVRKAPPTR